MCVFAGTNPFHRHQQINRMIAGWQTLETVVAIDNQWTSTCRFADIVLPATTQFERNDLDQYGNHSNRGILAMKQLVPPQFEARNDFDIFRGLCQRFNREQAFSEGLDEMGWIKRIYQEGARQGKGREIHLPTFDTFWSGSGYIEFGDPQLFVRHQAFRDDPDLEPLGTPSGLIEIYSKSIADMHYGDCGATRCGSKRPSAPTAAPAQRAFRCTYSRCTLTSACTRSCANRRRCGRTTASADASRSLSARRMLRHAGSATAISSGYSTSAVRFWPAPCSPIAMYPG